MTDGQVEVVLVDSTEEVQAFLSWLGERRPLLAFDLETTGLDPWRDTIRLAQFGDAETGWALPYDEWKGLVRHVLDRYEGPIAAHNLKFEGSMTERDGLHMPRGRSHDTMPMVHLDDNNGAKGLKRAAATRLGGWALRGERELKDAMKKGKWTWATVPVNLREYWQYGAFDTCLTAMLADYCWPRIQTWRDAYERELAITWILTDMELRGMAVDVEYCARTRAELEQEAGEVASHWPDVNLGSGAQIARALRADGVKLTRFTEKGNVQMDKEVLQSIDHDLARDAITYRNRRHWATSYMGSFIDQEIDGLVHPDIRPLGAEKTGRMSISEPPLQQLPRDARVRDAVWAREGNSLVLADYSQQEMRLLAHYSGDERMMQAFHDGLDLHTFVAQQVYNVEVPSKKQRQTAKSSAFAKVYGAGPAKFAKTAGITLAEGKAFLARYDRMFPGVPRFSHDAIATVRARRDHDDNGFITTFGGRVLKVPLGKSYVAVNYTIQGGCADITKDAMVELDRAGLAEFMVLPVHDEVIFDVPDDLVEEVQPVIRDCMERHDLRVPLPIDIEVCKRWGDKYREAA